MTNEELKYLLEYLGKEMGYVAIDDYKYDSEEQLKFESIIYGALVLYRDGKVKKSKLEKVHEQFRNSIDENNSESLRKIKDTALRLLDYPEITDENALEVYHKINELVDRKKKVLFEAMPIGILEYYYRTNTLGENLKIISDKVLKEYQELVLIFDNIEHKNEILEAINQEINSRNDFNVKKK